MRTKHGFEWRVDADGEVELDAEMPAIYLTRADIEEMLEELGDRMPAPGDTKVSWRR